MVCVGCMLYFVVGSFVLVQSLRPLHVLPSVEQESVNCKSIQHSLGRRSYNLGLSTFLEN